MVAGARTDGGNQQQPQQRQTSTQVRKVIQSLKEIVGNHSDADIYAVLKESNMDPNETAQKLLNQDPFHEVKRKRDKKKEITGYRGFSDTRRHMEYNLQPAKPYITWDGNVQRRDYNRNTLPGSNREVRVVREYRVKQNAKRDVNPESVHNSASEKEEAKFNLQNISSTGVLGDQKQLATHNSERLMSSVRQPCDSAAGHTKGVVPTSTCMSPLLGKTQATASTLNSQTQREGHDSSKENSSLTLSNSVVGVYSSASDPVHVPSPASRPAGTVGAIRREVGVVGVRKQSSCQSATNSAVPNSSFSVPLSAKDISSPKEPFEQSGGTPKHNQINQVVASDPVISNESTNRSFSGSQQNIKVTQHSTGHQKANQSTMEWKPKSSQKPTVISPIVTAPPSSSCVVDASSSSNPADVSNLTKKLSQVNVLEEPHVIIPQHLQVPESEYTKLTFGSFAAGFNSTKSFSSARQALKNAELHDEPSVSLSVSVPVSPSENTSADDQVDMSACQASSRSESPASAAETEQSASGNTESLNHQNIENYADIGMVESPSPPYSSPQTHQLPTPSLPSFSAYEPRSSYGIPFLRTVAEDNIHGQGFSSPEALSLHATNNSSSSMVALMQPQQQSTQQQQPPVTNLYPQVHFSHFPNFVPYRHVFSPVYVPPMAIPNYSNNPAYPHPSNGSNYF
ncbi:uncharacterized protein M6B38_381295 [Iris pallida]|uniref:GBF-interacting protein 1 N-terminal domain-containing protein n=1 Tax=Iris pallida TaxID=29817 RepID=A0AAX6G8C4_IRIPA|nr:uncharacterized protein M6B38_381295 [Iris pallida]